MHALLGAEEPVGVLARGAERRRLDAGLLPRAGLEQLDLEAAPLGPAHQHAQHHLGPVLGVGAAGAGVDGHERVAARRSGRRTGAAPRARRGAARPTRTAPRARPASSGPRRPARRGPRGPRRRRCRRAERLEPALAARACSAPTAAAASGSSQKPGAPICVLERGDARGSAQRVKDSPRAAVSWSRIAARRCGVGSDAGRWPSSRQRIGPASLRTDSRASELVIIDPTFRERWRSPASRALGTCQFIVEKE